MNSAKFNKESFPIWRRCLFYVGTIFALSVYYANYSGNFKEGVTEGVGLQTLLIRIVAVACLVTALLPVRLRSWSSVMIQGLYLYGFLSFTLAASLHGYLNDNLFLNTIIQLPILFALVGTRFEIVYVRWLNFIFRILGLQVIFDILVWQSGQSLWLSAAFVGGLGNPSSFGLLCVLGVIFYIFYPLVGRERWMMVLLLTFGAFQTKALLAVLGIAVVFIAWISISWRRTRLATISVVLLAVSSVFLLSSRSSDGEFGFLGHKLMAIGSLLSLVEYDVDSSASVSQRIEMHERTFGEIASDPLALIIGHLQGLPYWPMDSQLLTYLGSFGALFLVLFLALHVYWMICAWRRRKEDNGFSLLSLFIFAIIFVTNRILDYYPVAMIYFIIVAMVLDGHSKIRIKNPKQGAVSKVKYNAAFVNR